MITAFPPWSPNTIIERAVIEFDSPDISFESPWEDVLPVVRAFLRHRFSNYDELCHSNPEQHGQLKEEVYRRMVRHYKWLNSGKDPRSEVEEVAKPLLDRASAFRCDLVELRAEIIRSMRRYAPKERVSMREHLMEVETVIDQIGILFEPDRLLGRRHKKLCYEFASVDLPASHIKVLGFSCPFCKRRVFRSKRPMKVGAGRHLFVLSCMCYELMCGPDDAHDVTEQQWAVSVARDEFSAAFALESRGSTHPIDPNAKIELGDAYGF